MIKSGYVYYHSSMGGADRYIAICNLDQPKVEFVIVSINRIGVIYSNMRMSFTRREWLDVRQNLLKKMSLYLPQTIREFKEKHGDFAS